MMASYAAWWSYGILLLMSKLVEHTYAISASFYGDSHMRLPLEDSSSETDIKLQFRTHRADGLLLLAAGNTDFCVIELRRGVIHVRIDLGSGDTHVTSPPGLVFNDERWHSVHLMRAQEAVLLVVDNIHTRSARTTGKFYDLNIYYVILGDSYGSTSATEDTFFGNFRPFRGCLRDMTFNSIDLFQIAKADDIDPMAIYSATWGCSDEFMLTSNATDVISFKHNSSFLVLPRLGARVEARITFDLRTNSQSALLVYNAGRLRTSDFIAVELRAGYVIMTVDKGNGGVFLKSKKSVGDGSWHKVELSVDVTGMRVSVDGERRARRDDSGESQHLDLHSDLNIGGVNVLQRQNAVDRGLLSLAGDNAAAGSLIGCLRNLKVNGIAVGLRHAKITRGLQPTCLWSFPCSSSPCLTSATCIEDGFYHFRCVCAQANCFRRTSPTATGSSASHVVRVQDIVVREGATVVLNSNHIQLLVNHTAHRIRSSSVIFTVVKNPRHGRIVVDARPEQNPVVFTLLDLIGGRVSYTQDGAESSSDDVNMKLRFSAIDESVPADFRRDYAFSLRVRVQPWNDSPTITLLDGGVLHMVANTHVLLTRWIIEATDRDDPPRDLRYTVHYVAGASDVGFFELATPAGVYARVTTFTQQNINDGRVRYVHRGVPRHSVSLQVSDGKDTSESRTLRIVAAPLQIRQVLNTGIMLAATSVQLISRNNLSYATNAPHQQVELRYEVVEPPYFGEVQRQQRADNAWVAVTTFTQDDVDESRLRYSHSNPSRINQDYFKFTVGAMQVRTAPAEFIMTFFPTRVTLTTNASLVLRGVREVELSRRELNAKSTVATHTPKDIVYTLLATPSRGQLMRPSGKNRQRLSVGANFTQADINSERIVYRLHKMLYVRTRDQFRFRLRVPGNDSLNAYVCYIIFEPADGSVSGVKFTNEGISGVLEGGTKILGREYIYLQTTKNQEFQFRIIEAPRHGTLELLSPGGSAGGLVNSNITRFTNANIRAGRVQYHHDDSENFSDSFRFVAQPNGKETRPDGDMVTFRGTFDISITPRNDNTPRRVITKVFDVVANGGRRVTTDDIRYEDPDVDFDSSTLVYSREKLQNGEIVLTSNHSNPVYKFTQADLSTGRIYFQHHGPSYAKLLFWVTDGQFYTNCLLEVRVTEPYVRIAVNTGVVIAAGSRVTIHPSNFSVTTNIDATDEDIRFYVIDRPSYGKIMLNGAEANEFTMADIKHGAVTYQHSNVSLSEDSVRLSIQVKSARVEAEITIQVTSSGRQSKMPELITNVPLILNERERSTISDKMLVTGGKPSTNIRYTITEHPRFGVLMLKGRQTEKELLLTFNQQDINKGRLVYRHKNLDSDWDSFEFDVTSGDATLRHQKFSIEIVPAIVPLRIKQFKLNEGETRSLTGIISIESPHFVDDSPLYMLVRPPSHGWLALKHMPRTRITRFRQAQLDNERVCYVQDGSDVTSDRFSLMVRADGRHSQPRTADVTVIPVNDELPRLLINQPLDVFPGSTTVIDSAYLKVVDADTPSRKLIYVISNPLNGIVTLIGRQHENIVNFTQMDIDLEQVAFVHAGVATGGEFDFVVNDGSNYAGRSTFRVRTKPLELTMINHRKLEAFPGLLQPITLRTISARTNDPDRTRNILYTLQTKPLHGSLRYQKNGDEKEITNFTQSDIDNGRVGYRYTSRVRAPTVTPNWHATDTFDFEISTAFAETISRRSLEISVSYRHVNDDNRAMLIVGDVPNVEEGGSVIISPEHLNPARLLRRLRDSVLRDTSLSYLILSPPSHGTLIIENTNATRNSRFTQEHVEHDHVTYMHDGSDTQWDSFTYLVEIGGATDPKAQQQANTFNISITPVNDQPFVLETDAPSINIIQGFLCNITREHLRTVDPDTSPEDISYQVVNGPSNGHMALLGAEDTPIQRFTQADINADRVLFMHDGSSESGAFYFRVSDGHFKALYTVFNIHVRPLTLELINKTAIRITQGKAAVLVTQHNLGAETNGFRKAVSYNVTRHPRHGRLFLDDELTVQFNQGDIDSGRVTYVQTDLAASIDDFDFVVYDARNVVVDQTLSVQVRALLRRSQQPFPASADGETLITLAALDASELAALTDSDPEYIITRQPRVGKLIRRSNRTRRNVEETVAKFSHSEVADNVIAYRTNPSIASTETNDTIAFRLTAPNSQPASSSLKIAVIASPTVASAASPTTPRQLITDQSLIPAASTTLVSTDDVTQRQANAVDADHLMIIFLVCGITVMVIVVCVAVKCVKMQRRRRKKEEMSLAEAESEEARFPLAHVGAQPMESRRLPYAAYQGDRQNEPRALTQPLFNDAEPQSYDAFPLSVYSGSPTSVAPQYQPTTDNNSSSNIRTRSSTPVVRVQPKSPSTPTSAHVSRSPPASDTSAPRSPVSAVRVTPPTIPVGAQSPYRGRSEVSRTVPKCRVTPLSDTEESDAGGSTEPPSEQISFDWDSVDPELLQHCRTTNPVLHDSKYWV